MEAGFQRNNNKVKKYCSKMLELAAMDDVDGFIREVEEMGSDLDEVSFWYGRRFGSLKMGFEERTPIMIASMYGSTQVLKYIIGTGKVNVNKSCGSDGATALHCAAAGGSLAAVEVVKLLIDAFSDINAVDSEGNKPCDLIPPSIVKNSKRKTVELLKGAEKKEYPSDVSLPDINNGIYGSDEFRMYSFKVKPCSRAYSHDWTECPFVHPGENARRRDLMKYHYTCVPCPEFKKGSCVKGDLCEYAHGVFESWLHPAQYKTRLCKDETGCTRKVCFFAHKSEELRPVYASTGSAIPSPRSTPPASPTVNCSTPIGRNLWLNKLNFGTPPALQLPGSRLKTSLNLREVDLDLELLGLEQIRQQEEIGSPYSRIGDESFDPCLLSQLQGLSPKFNNSPSNHKVCQNTNQICPGYSSNFSLAPARKSSTFGFETATHMMNSISSSFSIRSQSFIDRSSGKSTFSGSPYPPSPKHSDWSSPDRKLEWGFLGEEASKFRKSASFNHHEPSMASRYEPDVPSGHDATPPWADRRTPAIDGLTGFITTPS